MLPCMYPQQKYVLEVVGSAMALVKLERPADSNASTGRSPRKGSTGAFCESFPFRAPQDRFVRE